MQFNANAIPLTLEIPQFKKYMQARMSMIVMLEQFSLTGILHLGLSKLHEKRILFSGIVRFFKF